MTAIEICQRCSKTYRGTAKSWYCPDCRKEAARKSAKERGLSKLGVDARRMRELAALIWLEAQGEPADGQQAVAEVVLNRVLSDEFPDTVHGVIYDTKYGVQFTPYKRVASTTPTEAQYEAVHNALYGDLILDEDVLYFPHGASIEAECVAWYKLPEDKEATE